MKTTADWNKTSYANRKAKGLWLNRKQRILIEQGSRAAKAYEAWVGMKTRCKASTASNKCYIGISVCSRWEESFDAFLEDMGLPASFESIDRIDSKKNYSPENCRWADSKTQGRNTSKSRINMRDAEDIRMWYATGEFSQTQIAKAYGILQVSVSQIVRRTIWS
jgi:hypothetical protein